MQGKVVAITGASRGIGAAAARVFAAAGAKVALLARSGAEVEALAAEIGPDAMAVVCDVAEWDSVRAAVAAVLARFGRLDVLVCNAGVMPQGPFATADLAELRRALDINIWGAIYPLQPAFRHMLATGYGRVVLTGSMHPLAAIFISILVVAVTYFVVFVERGQRKILVNYARRQVGNKVYGGQSSHLPLKLNMAGVIPAIFASSIILLPATVVGWFSTGDSLRWLKDISAALTPGQPIYVALYGAAIVFFCFFYTALVFNSRETADNLKKSGAFIPGIRPGDHTARHIDKILSRLTFAGAIYITLVCLLPEFLILKYNVPFYFGGTSLLIIVVVTMDFMAQVQNYMMSQQYDSLLKKANFKG